MGAANVGARLNTYIQNAEDRMSSFFCTMWRFELPYREIRFGKQMQMYGINE